MRRFNILREDNLLDNTEDNNININVSIDNVKNDELSQKFIKELTEALEKFNKEAELDNVKLTEDEEWEFEREKDKFLQDYFKKVLSNIENGETFIVTDKYENDNELNRYKVTQYKNNAEYKYVAFAKDLPKDVKIGDVVRRKDGEYIYDDSATRFVKDTIKKIKQEIIEKRKTNHE